jgi:CRP-like cAMP-binding protein
MPRHQLAAVHELARIEMLAGLPGDTLGRLAERMTRHDLAPGELVLQSEDERGRFWVVISGMLRSGGGRLLRPGESVGGLTPYAEPLQAMTPAVVASCDQSTFDELVRPAIGGA